MPRKLPALASLVAILVTACAYDGHFEDCAVRCATDGAACPDGLSCGGEGLCRVPGILTACAVTDAPTGDTLPRCAGLAATCGPGSNDDCCSTATPIPGGTFYRSYDVAGDGMFPDTSYPATVSAFQLDKYEVTVGRFRAFVNAGMGTRMNPPAIDTGARTLNGSADQAGWDPSWDPNLASDTLSLAAVVQCDSTYQTWTDTPGAHEDLPMNCVTWYEAFAFCAWDGGFLPTEAEWNFATTGGSEQRAYPWSSPAGSTTIDCSYANYDSDSGTYCANEGAGGTTLVGSTSPKGDGKWGHADLGGNVFEWNLDWYAPAYTTADCIDCADLTPTDKRAARGGGYYLTSDYLRTGNRYFDTPSTRFPGLGLRCVRPAS